MPEPIPVGLRVDGLRDPIGLGNRVPRLSWKLEAAGERDVHQGAYQVQVFLGGEDRPQWDSGRVSSRNSIDVAYSGTPLASRARCRWRVRVWPSQAAPGPWSEPARWEMGLLERADWI